MIGESEVIPRKETLEAPSTDKRGASSGKRLVVVSNRVADPKSAAKAGGLAVALKDALLDGGGLWFGWNGNTSEGDPSAPESQMVDGITYATTDLSPHEHATYYQGFANQVLWPILHQRIEFANFNDAFRDGYYAVNERFAQHLKNAVDPSDVIWVHDYHLLPLGHALRRLGCRQRMGLFLHTPMPHRQYLVMMPRHRDLFRRLMSYDVIGFQTEQDVENFVDYAIRELGVSRTSKGQLLDDGRAVTVKAFPIGIDLDDIRSFAGRATYKREMAAMKRDLVGCQQIIGAERLDYSKGLPERFLAFERLFRDHEGFEGKVRLLQIASPSRSSLQPYRAIRRTLDRLSGSINSELGDEKWRPIVYVRRTVTRPKLMSWFGASRVGLVTPLRDGMNLVAKEYVAAQPPDDPGVLVLSEFAGAAEQMNAALLVNPYDIKGTAEALAKALRMPLGERRERYADLIATVESTDIHQWRVRFLQELRNPAAAAN
jgi:trehalose 6-phosphate synthase